MSKEICQICGAPMELIIIRDAIAGVGSTTAAWYDWDHKVPDDCLKTINGKLDYLIERVCPNNGQEA